MGSTVDYGRIGTCNTAEELATSGTDDDAILSPIRNTHDEHIAWKHDVIHKTGNTQHIAMKQEQDRAMARVNMHRKCGEVWLCGSRDMQTDRRHTRHNTLRLSPIAVPPPRKQ